MTDYAALKNRLRAAPRRWLVTGVAGFIGSNILETLLSLDQTVTGLDNLSTGRLENLDQVRQRVGAERYGRFRFIKGDVCDPAAAADALTNVELVLHQAAIGSVPRSIDDPLESNASNVTGHLNLLHLASRAGVKRFVYASSSAVYGDDDAMAKTEDRIGRPLSPYAVTKYVDELYAEVIGRLTGLETIGLRYFNIFGPRQDPNGAYAAVIPTWIAAMIRGAEVKILGTGETSRDFCYVQNVVQANLTAALTDRTEAIGQVYNIGLGQRTSLNELFDILKRALTPRHPALASLQPVYGPFRQGDVLHSMADVSKAHRLLGFKPGYSIEAGLAEALDWYEANL